MFLICLGNVAWVLTNPFLSRIFYGVSLKTSIHCYYHSGEPGFLKAPAPGLLPRVHSVSRAARQWLWGERGNILSLCTALEKNLSSFCLWPIPICPVSVAIPHFAVLDSLWFPKLGFCICYSVAWHGLPSGLPASFSVKAHSAMTP